MIKLTRPTCPNPSALAGSNYKHPDNKNALIKCNNGKCMYCESKITHVYYGDVEHIKPKSIFPSLEFDWDNLGFVCAKCNGIKDNKYDTTIPFINPYIENPEDFIIASGALLFHKQGSEKGEITIDEDNGIGLNRTELVGQRLERIKTISKAIDACYRTTNVALRQKALMSLKDEASPDKEYSLSVKYLFKSQGIL